MTVNNQLSFVSTPLLSNQRPNPVCCAISQRFSLQSVSGYLPLDAGCGKIGNASHTYTATQYECLHSFAPGEYFPELV
jgi:hypothetical protein